ncbi:hypothetical protein [Leisingera daeponensis]|uniref:hypothetical protein n=1 Tax=Leisingera daeponensis TaxID=405746 RepID=UPI0021BD7215|nr:hypothetical protein [Leisingera daeponensis]
MVFTQSETAAQATVGPQPAGTAEPFAALGLDDFEAGLLPLLRHFLAGLRRPGGQGWQHAFHTAAERWGETYGLAVAYALFKIIRALEDVRPERLNSHDALCLETRECLTADEQALLQMIHYMRRDQTPAARQAVADAALGRMDPQVIRAGLAFARRFPCSGAETAPRAGPVLRTVG